MILNPLLVNGSLAKFILFHFPRKFNVGALPRPSLNPLKWFSKTSSRLQLACNALDGFSDQESEKDFRGIQFLHLMETRGVGANCETYVWLLDSCLNFGSLADYKKLHGKILKAGFGGDRVLREKLMDVYHAASDIDGVMNVFDDVPETSVVTWNKLLSGFLAYKMGSEVLALFSRMANENVNPNEMTFAYVLRACAEGNVPLHCIEQRRLSLGRRGGPKYLAGPGLVVPDVGSRSNHLEEAEGTGSDDVSAVHVALGGEVVDLVGEDG